jgi:hypothetical protein
VTHVYCELTGSQCADVLVTRPLTISPARNVDRYHTVVARKVPFFCGPRTNASEGATKMMSGEPQQRSQHYQPQSTTDPQDDVRFSRAALLSGRSLYWDAAPVDNADGVFTLIRWCLNLPKARLGVSPYDVARILRGLYGGVHGEPPVPVMRLFDRFGVTNVQVLPWYADQRWMARRSDLVVWLTTATDRNDYIWLEPDDAQWWLEATKESLLSYAELFEMNVDSGVLFDLLSRHRCTVFAPFDGAATWDHLAALISAMSDSNRQASYRQRLQRDPFTRDNFDAITEAYWSWRLLDFSDADGSIIYTPLFATWNYWPESAEWAPPSLATATTQPSFSSAEVAQLLTNVFWVQVETIFSIAREACALGQALSEFAAIETRPPVFFYAAPTTPPLRAEEYGESLRDVISPLISGCLLSEDPLSAQVAWGLVEGRLVALRSEISNSQFYMPRYLLFPTSTINLHRTNEQDIGLVANQLTYLEFTIGLEAKYTSTDIEPLSVRSALWGGTLDRVADVTGDAADLLASAGRRQTAAINRRLTSLYMTLRRLETFIETATSDSTGIERKHRGYVDGTDDFMRRQFTASVVPHITATNLRHALLNAYPYQYVNEPLKSLQITMRDLLSSVERSSGAVNTILERSDRQAREALASLGRWVGALVTLLALVVGLLQVIGTQSPSASTATQANAQSFIAQYFPWLTPATPVLFAVLGGFLILASAIYFLHWLRQFLPKRRHRFLHDIQQFRAVINAAGSLRDAAIQAQLTLAPDGDSSGTRSEREHFDWWRDLDKLDDEASTILAGLWQGLRRAQDEIANNAEGYRRTSRRILVRTPGVREWAVRAHNLEHTIELFDLAPERIMLPRTLCVLRYKTTDFYRRTTVSTGDLNVSLRAVGFTTEEIKALEFWLSTPENQRQIRQWDVPTFTRMLRAHGVSAAPQDRKPDQWKGSLDVLS